MVFYLINTHPQQGSVNVIAIGNDDDPILGRQNTLCTIANGEVL
jgi:hypothetical protein